MKTYKEFMAEAFVDFNDKSNPPVEFPKQLIRVVASMTKDNNHNEARIIIADQLASVGNRSGKGYIKTYTNFSKMAEKGDGLSQGALKSRSNTDKGMKQELQRTFSNWKAVWMAL